jgi:hypothetical protein
MTSFISRNRKTRCDGAKPVCYNCSKRASGGDVECTYDSIPKRRGPDRTPGARQRSNRGLRDEGEEQQPRRRRRSTIDSSSQEMVSTNESPAQLNPIQPLTEQMGAHAYLSPTSPRSNESRSPLGYLQTPTSGTVPIVSHSALGKARGEASPAQVF